MGCESTRRGIDRLCCPATTREAEGCGTSNNLRNSWEALPRGNLVSMLLALALLTSAHLTSQNPEVPARQPQLAVRGDEIAMAFGAGNAIYFRRSVDKGRTFSDPVKVAESTYIPIGMHRGPRVGFAGKTIVMSAIAGVGKQRGADGNLYAWRSNDGGQTWSKPIQVNDLRRMRLGKGCTAWTPCPTALFF